MFLSFIPPCFTLCGITHSVNTLHLVIDNRHQVMQNKSVGGHVDCQKWTESLANAGRFGFALSGTDRDTETPALMLRK